MEKYASIKKAAKIIGLPEHRLRVMVKRGEIPGFYGGCKYNVHLQKTIELFDRMSELSNSKEDAAANES